jgi:hypothetical protein
MFVPIASYITCLHEAFLPVGLAPFPGSSLLATGSGRHVEAVFNYADPSSQPVPFSHTTLTLAT